MYLGLVQPGAGRTILGGRGSCVSRRLDSPTDARSVGPVGGRGPRVEQEILLRDFGPILVFCCPSDRLSANKCPAVARTEPRPPGMFVAGRGAVGGIGGDCVWAKRVGRPCGWCLADAGAAEPTRRSAPPPPGAWHLQTVWCGCESSGGSDGASPSRNVRGRTGRGG